MNTSILIASQVGTDISSRSRAARLRAEVVREIANGTETVTLDFTDVRTVSESFADELFAVLVADYGDEWFRRHIIVTNLTTFQRKTILTAVANRICPA